MSPQPAGRSGRRLLLAIPAVAVPAAIAAVILVPIQAIGAVDLPDKTPQELLAFAESSAVTQLSGTLSQTSDLGLPDLGALMPGAGESSTTTSGDIDSLLSLATGSYTARVYLDDERARLQVLDSLAERNVYVDAAAGAAWYVDSESQTATRLALAAGTDLSQYDGMRDSAAQKALPTPEAMLDQALTDLDPTTQITVGTDSRVAGRDVYELVLTPRSDDTLIGSIRFALDGETGTALAASITARGADQPAFSIAFTDVSFAAPDASALTFTPGADITVIDKNITLPNAAQVDQWRAEAKAGEARPDAAAPIVIGDGWSAVVEMPAQQDGPAMDALTAEQTRMLETATTPVDGGRVFETSLVTVLITDDGRILAGAVSADRLVEAAAASGR